MRDYSAASDEISELSHALLGSGRRPNTATALGKLQRAYRNNAQSAYSRGQNLIDKIDEGSVLKDALAGQALNSYIPRGGLGGSLGGMAGAWASFNRPSALLALPLFSPRIMGNVAYGAGRASTALKPILKPLNPVALAAPFSEKY